MTEEKKDDPGQDPEMSKKTQVREDPEVHKKTMRSEDPELDVSTAYREGPVAADDPGSIEFQVESVDGGDDTAVIQRAGHVIRVGPATPSVKSEFRYELRDELGSGGMAIVSAAWDGQLQRSVAVKRLRQELASSPKAVERFFDEAYVIAGLDHPGVVPVFDKGTMPNGEAFYSMKRVSGKTFEDLISRRAPDEIGRREDIAKYVDIFERICQTMAAAHKAGVVHRDLKPTNVMVDEFGSVLVMDWGLAKRIGDESGDSKKTVAGALLGTPSYMSPEQATGQAHKSDCRSDVFSLGVVLYEILTGVNPFNRETIKESLDVVVHLEPQSPRDYNPSVDRDLSAICMKAMSKDPVNRYLSARDLADDIRRYREFRPVSARTPGFLDRISRWWRRNPRLGGAAAAVVLMALILGASIVNQRFAESELVSQGFSRIEQARANLESIEAEREELIARLNDVGLSESERSQVEARLEQLSVMEEFQLDEEEAMALAITGFTILHPDEKAQRIIRERTMTKIDADLAAERWFAARVKIESALDRASRANILDWSPEELAALGEKLAQAKQGQSRAGK